MASLESLFNTIDNIRVLDSSIPYSDYLPLDLTEANQNLNQFDISDSNQFEKYLNNYLDKNNAQVAFGGYMEKRTLYKRSSVFNDAFSEERNIHIGIDLWTKANTPILAALDGIVHSFQNNDSIGDYGPTIILQHQLEGNVFYTLYGHLTLKSISSIQKGDFFAKGQTMATLGDASINGDYAPHLHFQIIKNIEDYFGDYPGVCSQNKTKYYLNNCPDPNLLLKIPSKN